MTLLLALNLLSGMRIGWGYQESPFGGLEGTWAKVLATVSPKATMFGINLIVLHVWSAFLLLLVAGMYVGYLFRSGTARKLSVSRADLRKLVAGLRSRHFFRSKPALWSANVLVYWVSFIFIAVLTVTGFALYRLDFGMVGLLGGYDLVRLLHALVGYLLIPYTVLHAVLQWCFGRFWPIFKAQVGRRHVLAGLIGFGIAAPLAAGAYFLDRVPETLTVPRIGNVPAPVLDGDPSDTVWTLANPVTIHTAKATNSPGHVADITVRAVHDGAHVYFQFEWNDPDVSYKRYPLLKTEGGWKVVQNAFERADENEYYEDKLSMYITNVRNGSCATTCHLGAGPLSAKGEKHGLHYTNGEIGDIWHWKAVRTNPVGDRTGEPGYVDDLYFGPETPVKPGQRYTGGYFQDPSQGGGYTYSFVKVDPTKPLADTFVIPKFLPPAKAVHTDMDPATHEYGREWWIHRAEAIPYTKEADTYPAGTLIPSIVIGPLTGDTGDVRGKAAWKAGRWTLETRRVLDTGSRHDVAFLPGEPVYITVAIYNRTQTRHSEHIKPVRVVLQP
jgi:cytochrome b subunit of formate dehydrogenase